MEEPSRWCLRYMKDSVNISDLARPTSSRRAHHFSTSLPGETNHGTRRQLPQRNVSTDICSDLDGESTTAECRWDSTRNRGNGGYSSSS